MDHIPPPFFNRGPAPLVRLAFFASLSLRSEEHTSELQSRLHLVCRLLLEKKNKTYIPLNSRITSPSISAFSISLTLYTSSPTSTYTSVYRSPPCFSFPYSSSYTPPSLPRR